MGDEDHAVVEKYLMEVQSHFSSHESKSCRLLLDELTQHVADVLDEEPGLTLEDIVDRFGSPRVAAVNLRKANRIEEGSSPFPWYKLIGIMCAVGAGLVIIFKVTMT